MNRLGYTRYVAQGGDWDAIITDLMAAQAPSGLIGITRIWLLSFHPSRQAALGWQSAAFRSLGR